MRPTYVYLLHFSRLSHAEHYCGSTENLKSRLEAHARGAGSRLTRELHRQSITWELGGLYECSFVTSRVVERAMKDQKNGPRYCHLCNPSPARIPHGRSIDTSLVPFPKSSMDFLKTTPAPLPRIAVHTLDGTTTVQPATESSLFVDSHFMRTLSAKEPQLGYIPIGGKQGATAAIKDGRVFIATTDGLSIGFCLFSRNYKTQQLTIAQVAVCDEYRLNGTGRLLVEAVMAAHPGWDGTCHVRADLPAIDFWHAIGWKEIRSKRHATSGNILVQFYLAQRKAA